MIIWPTIIVSVAFFLASLGMTALVLNDAKTVSGLQTLLFGWLGMLAWQFPWLANPAYLAALVLTACHRFGAAQACVLVALGFGLLSNFTFVWYVGSSHSTPIIALGPAFYCWLGSFLVLLGGATIATLAV